jgi:hypothetical protein
MKIGDRTREGIATLPEVCDFGHIVRITTDTAGESRIPELVLHVASPQTDVKAGGSFEHIPQSG